MYVCVKTTWWYAKDLANIQHGTLWGVIIYSTLKMPYNLHASVHDSNIMLLEGNAYFIKGTKKLN
jgi:hypothetical protein